MCVDFMKDNQTYRFSDESSVNHFRLVIDTSAVDSGHIFDQNSRPAIISF